MAGKLTEMTNIMSETVNALSKMQKSMESMHIKNLKTNDSIREQTKAYANLQKQLQQQEQWKNASIKTTIKEQKLAKENVLQIIHNGKVIKDLNKAGKEKRKVLKKSTKQTKKYTEATKKSAEELEGYSDQFSHLRHQILNVHTVTKDMEKTFLAGISESKGWTAFSRFVSGTALWKFQNKIRGVVDVMRIMEKRRIANIEKTEKETQALDNLAKAEIELNKQKVKFDVLAFKNNDKQLQQEFATYAIMRKKGVAQEDAIKLMKLEFKELEQINKANEKRGFGGRFTKALEKRKASKKLAGAEFKDLIATKEYKPATAKKVAKFVKGKEAQSGPFAEDFRKNIQKIFGDSIRKDLGKGFFEKIRKDEEKLIKLKAKYGEDDSGVKQFEESLGKRRAILAKGKLLGEDSEEGKKARLGFVQKRAKVREGTGQRELMFYKKQLKETKLMGGKQSILSKGLMNWSKRYKKRETLKEKWQRRIMAVEIWTMKFRIAIKKQLLPKLFMFLKTALGIFIWAMLLITGVFIVFKIVKSIWEGLAELRKSGDNLWQELKTQFQAFKGALIGVWDAAMELWEAFRSGDLFDFLDKLVEFAMSLWDLAWEGLKLLWDAIVVVGYSLMNSLFKWLQKPEHIQKLMKALAIVLTVLLVRHVALTALAYFVSWLSALSIWTVLLVGILVLTGTALLLWFGRYVGGILKDAIPGLATGGIGSGLTIVGEGGPELVDLPKGTRVHSNSDSKKILTKSSDKVINNNITVNVQGRIGASDREVRDMAEKVGRIISTKMSRTTTTI